MSPLLKGTFLFVGTPAKASLGHFDFRRLPGLYFNCFRGGVGLVGVLAAGERGDDVLAGRDGIEREGGIGVEVAAGAPFACLGAALRVDGDVRRRVRLAPRVDDLSL